MLYMYNYTYVQPVTFNPPQSMEEEFVRWMEWYGKSFGEFELMKGDFLDPAFNDIFQSAT